MMVMLTEALYQTATDERVLMRIRVSEITITAMLAAVEIQKNGRKFWYGISREINTNGRHVH